MQALTMSGVAASGWQFAWRALVTAKQIARALPLGVFLVAMVLCKAAQAQCAAGWLTMPPVQGMETDVRAFGALPDGDVIITGEFTKAGGTAVSFITRFNPASGQMTPLGVGLNGYGRVLTVLPDGDVIVGGTFTSAGGVPANRIARYSPASGAWSALGTGTDNEVRAIALLPGGDLLVGGFFLNAGGIPANRVARFNPTTGVWSALGAGANGTVRDFALLPSGEVLVAGDFTSAGGVTANRIARYNPTTGAWSAVGTGLNGGAVKLTLVPGGDVIVGGGFTTANGTSAQRIARYNPSSGAWSALGAGTSGIVYSTMVLPDGELLVVGDFSSAGGLGVRNTAKYNLTTGTWSALGLGTDGIVFASHNLPDGNVLLGGRFTTAGPGFANRLCRVHHSLGLWSPAGVGIAGSIACVAAAPDGSVLVGGDYSAAAGTIGAHRVGRYFPATNTWLAMGSGVGASHPPTCFLVLPDESVLVGSLFMSEIDGQLLGNTARYTPATNEWTSLTPEPGSPSTQSLALLPNGDVLLGSYNLARYTPTTRSLVYLSPMCCEARAYAPLPDGSYLVAANVGVGSPYISRYDPLTNTWSPVGTGANGVVFALATLPNGDVVAGGEFTMIGGVAANHIARYRPNTDTWEPLGSGTNAYVYSLAVRSDGSLVVGGSFTTAGGVPGRNLVAHYDPSTGNWTNLGTGLTGDFSYTPSVKSVTILSSGEVVAGGRFTYAGGSLSPNLARYTFGGSAPTVTSQPQAAQGCNRSEVSLSVGASGQPPLSFQWRKGGAPISVISNPSAATATLTLTDVQAADAGSYDCVITNACGNATSDAATLTVSCPNRSDVAHIGGGAGCDGLITVDDIVYYLSQFFAGNTAVADIVGLGGSGPPEGAITVDDLVAFLSAFFAGCP